MTFANLRSNNQLFILHKDSVPSLQIGKVVSASFPVPKYTNPGIYNPEMVLDITAELNGSTTNFQKLPANGEIADFGNNMVIACTKDAMSNEVKAIKQRSQDIVNSLGLHENIIKGCDEVLLQLNPEIKEKQRQEEESKALREEVNSLKEMFKEFMKSCQK